MRDFVLSVACDDLLRSRGYYKSEKFNRREPQRETAKNRKVLKYNLISLLNSAPSLRTSAVKKTFDTPSKYL